MFDKLKQLKKLKQMQSSLSSVQKTHKENGVEVTVNGEMKIINISLNEELDKEKQEKVLLSCINGALKEIKKEISENMRGELGL
ncbi:MAG TPA: YbaB/EbfC family nucleoid-associated protein [Patescibacteria group bacterium]|nr:YbaB/EbfC family nucleoid-associated protein [Patescibacteria group bacterium]